MPEKNRNEKNLLYYIPIHGFHKDKIFLFEESNHRWSSLRNFAAGRNNITEQNYLLLTNINGGTWEYWKYSEDIYHIDIPIPHVLYDIKRDKVYRLKCRLRPIVSDGPMGKTIVQ